MYMYTYICMCIDMEMDMFMYMYMCSLIAFILYYCSHTFSFYAELLHTHLCVCYLLSTAVVNFPDTSP